MIKSWSFSRYATFEQCPYRLKLQVIDKIPDKQPKKAADRGTAIHTMAEVFTAEGGDLPSELSAFSDEFSALHTLYKEGKVSLEGEWGFTNNWEPCAYNDAWLKVKADAVVFTSQTKAVVIDHKGLAVETPLPTPTGWTTMGKVAVGDELFSSSGEICKVTAKSKLKNIQCFEITFDDASRVVCDHEHLWKLADGRVVPVTELKKTDRVEVSKALNLPTQTLPIDPYVFGIWLADGKHTSSEVTKPDNFIWEEIQRRGYEISHDYSEKEGKGKCRTHTIKNIRGALTQLDVLGKKHIPSIYMRGSIEQRTNLLQGLMDGDGSANKLRKQVVINTTNKKIAKQIHELALSLGQRATLCSTLGKGFDKEVVVFWISFRPNNIKPFKLPRKAKACENFGPGRSSYRKIVSVNEVPSTTTQCISVDSADNTFLCTEKFIPTHNTGKRFGNEMKHAQQLQLYSLSTLIRRPEIQEVRAELWYLDQDELADMTMKRSQLGKYLKIWDAVGQKITSETEFKPKPNLLSCKYCCYRQDRQGDCKFGV